MQNYIDDKSYMVVINRGEEVIAQLMVHAREHGYVGAWVSGLGGASGVTLGFYNIETKQYEWHERHEPLEIVSLTGNMSVVDGEPFWHVHGMFAGRDLATFGGHVKELMVGLTCELHITPLSVPLTRQFDDATGLKLLRGQS